MDPEPDENPTEGKPADEPNEPPPPETSGRRIHRNNAEPLVVRRQQEATDDVRNPNDEKSGKQAEQPLAQHRRPIERKEGPDAAERKREAQGDEMQALPHRFRRERVEVGAGPLRRLAKQPFDDGAQTDENREEQQSLGPAVFTEVCGDKVVTSLVLGWQIGDRAGESNDMLADCSKTAIEGLRNGSLRGGLLGCCLGLALLFQ